jgi:hypothetical protein
MKKVTSILLSFLLIFSVFSTNAFSHTTNINKNTRVANVQEISNAFKIIKNSNTYKDLHKEHKLKLIKSNTEIDISTENPNIAVINTSINFDKKNKQAKAAVFTVDLDKKEILNWNVIELLTEKENYFEISITSKDFPDSKVTRFLKNGKILEDGVELSIDEYLKKEKEKYEQTEATKGEVSASAVTVCDWVTNISCGLVTATISTLVCGWVTTFSLGWLTWSCVSVASVTSTWVCVETNDWICHTEPDPEPDPCTTCSWV